MQELNQAKYNFRNWWVMIEVKQEEPYVERVKIYEKALKHIPWSYKIWYFYLNDCITQVKDKCPESQSFKVINGIFERALIFMHKMPRIWIIYA